MQKTKLGVSVGLVGAAVYFIGLFGGLLTALVLAGYILLAEDNEWLRKSAVKAIALVLSFAVFSGIINLIPNAITFINDIVAIFGGKFSMLFLNKVAIALNSGLDIVEKILFLGLGFKAFTQGTISIPFVDKMINKYMG